jgi:hypothetical protein
MHPRECRKTQKHDRPLENPPSRRGAKRVLLIINTNSQGAERAAGESKKPRESKLDDSHRDHAIFAHAFVKI